MSYREFFLMAMVILFASSTVNGSPDVFVDMPLSDVSSSSSQLDEVTVVWEYSFDDPGNSIEDWTFTDGGYQENCWFPRDYEPFGDDGMSWYCSPFYIWGGYEENKIQGLITPAMDLSGQTGVLLNFQLRLQTEQFYDGGCIMVWYGDNEDEAVRAVIDPVHGAAYNGEVEALSDAFGETINGWSGYDSDDPFDFNNWGIVSCNLDPYCAPYVRIGFVFASDANDEVGIGMLVDNVLVTGFSNTYFSDDADGNNVGGDFETRAGLALTDAPMFPNVFQFFNDEDSAENGFSAASAPNCMGINEYSPEIYYTHFIQGPNIQLPPLEYPLIDRLKLSFNVKTGFDNGNADPETQAFYYIPEFRRGMGNEGWKNANAISYDGANLAFDHYLNDGEWVNTMDVYNQGVWDLDISNLGAPVVEFRFRVVCKGIDLANGTNSEGDPINGFFDHLLWDDIKITHIRLEHDIETEVIVPWPNTVGYPIEPRVKFTNRSPRLDEANVIGECFINSFPTFLVPDATFDILSGQSVERVVMEMPFEPRAGERWIPYAPSTIDNPFPIYSTHQLETDELPRNDRFDASLVIQDVGTYELGYDARLQRRFNIGRTYNPVAVRIDPYDFEWFDENTDLILKGLVGGFWNDLTGNDPLPETLTWTIYEGDPAEPGDQIWSSGPVEVSVDPTQGQTQIVRHYLENEDYVTLPFEPFWIKLESQPYGSRTLFQRNDNIPHTDCPYIQFDDGEWVQFVYFETSRDAQIRAIVDGNIKPYFTTAMSPEDGTTINIDENPEVTFRWVGGSPDGEQMSYTLYLEDQDGNTLDFTSEETSYMIDFSDEEMYAANWSWYVRGTEESGLYTESQEFTLTTSSSGVHEYDGLPTSFDLGKAYPNPFNPSTTIRYQVPKPGFVNLVVTNVLGQVVDVLVNEQIQPGYYSKVFNAQGLSTGIYFIRMEAAGFSATQKIMLMK